MRNKKKEEVYLASYIGLCSRITSALKLQGNKLAPKWELSVVDAMVTMLVFHRPDLLEEIKKEMDLIVKENYSGKYISPVRQVK
tara:strand:+ start:2392 stop:2643 length:252 start_codon:yes stop_codon:yes gene_type:complete